MSLKRRLKALEQLWDKKNPEIIYHLIKVKIKDNTITGAEIHRYEKLNERLENRKILDLEGYKKDLADTKKAGKKYIFIRQSFLLDDFIDRGYKTTEGSKLLKEDLEKYIAENKAVKETLKVVYRTFSDTGNI